MVKQGQARAARPEEETDIVKTHLRDLRGRLLDFSTHNRLLSFKHSDRARGYVRVIDEQPDVLHEKLTGNGKMTFKPLPPIADEPADEVHADFVSEVAAARLADEIYRQAIEDLDPAKDNADAESKIERALKDRVRERLGMPERPTSKSQASLVNHAKSNGIDPSYDLPCLEESGGEVSYKWRDKEIQTLLLDDVLERKLRGIVDLTRSAFQETGINTLFVAFGFLEWTERANDGKHHFAPLLLLPVQITRTIRHHRYVFDIEGIDDDAVINHTLTSYLARDHAVSIPQLNDGETPERYFQRVAEAIDGKAGWAIRRWITVGVFPFARMAMYHDLDPANWPGENGLAGNDIVARLICGDGSDSGLYADEHEVESPEIEKLVPVLVTEADSSQHSAIADVMAGKCLAIKGPPGTGKSQTIANIIANAIHAGKRVLFVAEKMAALDVVANRLERFGLGHLVLELHSHKTRRADVLASLEARLKLVKQAKPTALEADLAEIRDVRTKLADYVHILNQAYGDTGLSVQQALWAEQRTRAVHHAMPEALQSKQIEYPDRIDRNEALRLADLLERMEMAAADLGFDGGVLDHPWRGVDKPCATPADEEGAVKAIKNWKTATETLLSETEVMRQEFGWAPERNEHDIQSFFETAESLDTLPGCPDLDLTVRMSDETSRSLVHAFIVETEACLESLNGYGGIFSFPLNVDPSAIRQAVTSWRSIAGEETTPADLERRSKTLSCQIDALAVLPDLSRPLLDITQYRDNVTPSVLGTLLDLAEFIGGRERKVFSMRTIGMISETADAVLAAAKDEAECLIETGRRIAEDFSLDATIDAHALSIHAGHLRAAGWFSFLSAEYRAAMKAWRMLRRSSSRKRNSHQMADDLAEIADYLSRRAAMSSDVEIGTLCGAFFKGANTDFAGIQAACSAIAESRRQFADPDALGSHCRHIIANADMIVIDAVRAFIDTDAYSALKQAVAAVGGNETTPVQILLEKRVGLRDLTDAVATAAKNAGFKDDASIDIPDSLIAEVEKAAQKRDDLDADRTIQEILGTPFMGTKTDFAPIHACMTFADDVVSRSLPEFIETRIFSSMEAVGQIAAWAKRLQPSLAEFHKARDEMLRTTGLDEEVFLDGVTQSVDLRRIIERTGECLAATKRLPAWMSWRRLFAQAEKEGVSFVPSAMIGDRRPLVGLADAYKAVLDHSRAHNIYHVYDPDIASLSGISQESLRKRFQRLDREILTFQRQMVAAAAANRVVPFGNGRGLKQSYTNLALIQHEISKKARHIPIRDLVKRAGRAMQALKPCFAMSPNSVAQHLPPGTISFDLVIIDEASQMRPEEAIGVLARSAQAVIVGDPKQLPPTSFFMRNTDDGNDDIDPEEVISEESILDLALSVFRPARDLRWHYRSRHHSLIAFSNMHFYDSRLLVFPSPVEDHRHFGVKSNFVEGATYRAGTNIAEARAVIEAAAQFMKTCPDRSLGVVSMNQRQRELILEEFDRLATQDDHVANYIARWEGRLEQFFVKNLENVQGDERDVIMISTVYGPEVSGGKVMQRFGPINSANGHRRLNVLFTRARENIILFTSMRANDIQVAEGSSQGVRALKAYLEYAETGLIAAGAETYREPDSDFEIFVKERLEALGCEVVPQVGVNGYFIDLGVRHPAYPHGFLMGIECDGASYHSGRSARDRDRLRQEVLEGLGWHLYRIWSTDWFHDPNVEFARLKRAIEARLADVAEV